MSSAVGSLPPRRRIGPPCVQSTGCPLFWCFGVARFHPSRNSQTFPIRHSSRLSARTMRLDTLVRLSLLRPVTYGSATGATQSCLDWWTTMASTISSLKKDRLSGTGTAVVGWNSAVPTEWQRATGTSVTELTGNMGNRPLRNRMSGGVAGVARSLFRSGRQGIAYWSGRLSRWLISSISPQSAIASESRYITRGSGDHSFGCALVKTGAFMSACSSGRQLRAFSARNQFTKERPQSPIRRENCSREKPHPRVRERPLRRRVTSISGTRCSRVVHLKA